MRTSLILVPLVNLLDTFFFHSLSFLILLGSCGCWLIWSCHLSHEAIKQICLILLLWLISLSSPSATSCRDLPIIMIIFYFDLCFLLNLCMMFCGAVLSMDLLLCDSFFLETLLLLRFLFSGLTLHRRLWSICSFIDRCPFDLFFGDCFLIFLICCSLSLLLLSFLLELLLLFGFLSSQNCP